jgi:hypothetical protein
MPLRLNAKASCGPFGYALIHAEIAAQIAANVPFAAHPIRPPDGQVSMATL